jgi:hypothetical protein
MRNIPSPFKGEVRRGMGCAVVRLLVSPHPHPNPPLEGEGAKEVRRFIRMALHMNAGFLPLQGGG